MEQLAACRAHNPEVVGSSPTLAIYDSIAQLVEQQTFNPWVAGSNPARVIHLIKMKNLTNID